MESESASLSLDSALLYKTGLPVSTLIAGCLILFVLFFCSAFLSAAELAFFSIHTDDLRKLRSSKDSRSESVIRLLNQPEKLLGTILISSNLVNIIIVLVSAFMSIRLFSIGEGKYAPFVLSMAVIVFLIIVFCEILPKVYTSGNNVRVALSSAGTVSAIERIMLPLTSLLLFSASFIKKRSSANGDLADALDPNSENIEEEEKILRGITNFGNINVSAIMCPRIDVTAIDIKSGFDKVIPVIINSGFSRIPVYSGSFDTIKGILYAKDVLPYTGNPPSFKWQSLLRPSYFVPETKKISDLLKEFQLRKIHMAIVIDEYGGTSGIVTLEDILEEIVGDITDESDEEETHFRRIDDNKYIFEGRVLLNDFCKILGIDESVFDNVRGEAETIAGLMLELTGEIPEKDKVIRFGDFIFRIEAVDRRRVLEVQVEIITKNDNLE